MNNSSSARRRKGIPSKAPSRSPTKQQNGVSQSSPKVIKASLLLLALLREARRTNTAISNQRFSSSSPTNKPVHRKREREILPPALPGYGRGQRSASASLSEVASHRYGNGNGVHHQNGREESPSDLGYGEASSSSRKLKPPPSLSLNGGGSRLKRSSSIEPLSVSDHHHLQVVGTAASNHGGASRNMGRSVSVGVGGGGGNHHHHHHDYTAPVIHSPLARSFSFDGKRERTPSAQGTRIGSSRKIDAPHHLQ